jgi:5'-3' exonuclease
MSLDALGLTDVVSKTLLIDGDIVIYQPCCIFNDDDDRSRIQIKKHISNKVDKMMADAGCDRFMFFVTTKFNFRDELVDDYKANRADTERPVNLAWAKRWCVNGVSAFYHKGLEADDLLGIHSGKNTVIWSLDKDLRQIEGEHLDYQPDPKNPKKDIGRVINVTKEGMLHLKEWTTEAGNARKKIVFNGNIGLYFQMLIGDTTDNILGCAVRKASAPKSGPNKGIMGKVKRVGVGEMKAYELCIKAIMNKKADLTDAQAILEMVKEEYYKIYKGNWQFHLELQANLLFMVRQQRGEIFRRWTVDNRKEYFHLTEGKILTEQVFLNDYA